MKLKPGHGAHGSWTNDDWIEYQEHREGIWNGDYSWPGVKQNGLGGFERDVQNLARFYGVGQKEYFVRATGLMFSGISYYDPWQKAAWDVKNGPLKSPHPLLMLPEGKKGFDPTLVDDSNPSHHYFGLFFIAYFAGGGTSELLNLGRDPNNPQDLKLGFIGAQHAVKFKQPYISPVDLAPWISQDLSVP